MKYKCKNILFQLRQLFLKSPDKPDKRLFVTIIDVKNRKPRNKIDKTLFVISITDIYEFT